MDEPVNPNCDTNCDRPPNLLRSLTGTARERLVLPIWRSRHSSIVRQARVVAPSSLISFRNDLWRWWAWPPCFTTAAHLVAIAPVLACARAPAEKIGRSATPSFCSCR
jgi:hypothetical protein